MRYRYVTKVFPGMRWLETRPLSVDFLRNGLFDMETLANAQAAPGHQVCVADGIGPDMTAPFDRLRDLVPKPADQAAGRLQELQKLYRRQQLRQHSKWQGNKSGPPPRPLAPVSRPVATPPVGGRGAGRGGVATLVATASIAAFRYSLIAQLSNRLDGFSHHIRSAVMKSPYSSALCIATYSFYTFTDNIGDNRPEMAALSVENPPKGSGNPVDHFSFLSHGRPARAVLEAGPAARHDYGDFNHHNAPNRRRATGFILAIP